MIRVSFLACLIGMSAGLQACRSHLEVTQGPGDGLTRREGKLWLEGEPFSGARVVRDPAGAPMERVAYAEGLRDGESLAWYPSGALRWKREFRRGLKHGRHVGWWENGHRKFEYRYAKGRYLGAAREWYADGRLAREMHYAEGRESGSQRAWRPNGALYSNYEARDGRNYGVVSARLCYSVKAGEGLYGSTR